MWSMIWKPTMRKFTRSLQDRNAFCVLSKLRSYQRIPMMPQQDVLVTTVPGVKGRSRLPMDRMWGQSSTLTASMRMNPTRRRQHLRRVETRRTIGQDCPSLLRGVENQKGRRKRSGFKISLVQRITLRMQVGDGWRLLLRQY